jgi:single-strand DNA-binding protein
MNTIIIRGRLATEVDLRYAQTGRAWATATVVSSRAVKNGDQWEEKDATFLTVKLFGQGAENAAESFAKGDPVIVVGRVVQENWTTDQGEKRSRLVVVADDIAASTRWHQVKVARLDRTSTSKPAGGRQPADPWAA